MYLLSPRGDSRHTYPSALIPGQLEQPPQGHRAIFRQWPLTSGSQQSAAQQQLSVSSSGRWRGEAHLCIRLSTVTMRSNRTSLMKRWWWRLLCMEEKNNNNNNQQSVTSVHTKIPQRFHLRLFFYPSLSCCTFWLCIMSHGHTNVPGAEQSFTSSVHKTLYSAASTHTHTLTAELPGREQVRSNRSNLGSSVLPKDTLSRQRGAGDWTTNRACFSWWTIWTTLTLPGGF